MSANLNLGNRYSGAILDPTQKYRYSLWREWEPENPRRVTFVMLNPSTADHKEDDNTITRCINFAKKFGGGSLEVVNLFAYRATDPKVLKSTNGDLVGPENDRYILEAIRKSSIMIAAWGENGIFQRRNEHVMKNLLGGHSVYCLKLLKGGQPGHPLFLSKDSELIPFMI